MHSSALDKVSPIAISHSSTSLVGGPTSPNATKRSCSAAQSIRFCRHYLNVLEEALSDQRCATTQQREIAECKSASDAGAYCSCCRTGLLQEHLRRLLAERSQACAGGRQVYECDGRAQAQKRAREQVVRQPEQVERGRLHFRPLWGRARRVHDKSTAGAQFQRTTGGLTENKDACRANIRVRLTMSER
eukprot:scaffold20709_cov59-Phaeocystis_antarctica.AAC.3